MIGTTRRLRVWTYGVPADLRQGFNGLSGLATNALGRELLSGDCFLFVSRTRRSAKVLVWDGTGLAIYHKRLERGRFAALWSDSSAVTLTLAELSLYLEGARLVTRVPLSPPAFELPARGAAKYHI